MCASRPRAFDFLRLNQREGKPRSRGLTEIRGPYYTPMGTRYLSDVLETMGAYIDSLKFAGGSFALMPATALKEIIELAHRHEVAVSTGGFIEYVLAHRHHAVDAYVRECKNVGFDIVELSTGFISLPMDDWLRLVQLVRKAGLKPKPEIGIQFGAGGASSAEALEAVGTGDPGRMIEQGQRLLEAGAEILMIESEGITESVRTWRTDVAAKVVSELGLDNVMFEAADPAVFAWYIRSYGADVNLFVDHSQIVQLECLRSGLWGTSELWGRVQTYRG